MNASTGASAEIAAEIAAVMTASLELPVDRIELDAPFADLELDSLVLVELAVLIEGRFGVEITELELATAGTLARTAELVRFRRGGHSDALPAR